jgi:hypothetical protein
MKDISLKFFENDSTNRVILDCWNIKYVIEFSFSLKF